MSVTTSADLAEETRNALRFLRMQQHVGDEFDAMNIDVRSIKRTVAASTLDCFNHPKLLLLSSEAECACSRSLFTTITFKGAGLETLSAALSSVGEVAVMVLGTIFVEFV